MTAIANHDQYDAWNGDSGTRWVATADRRDQVLAPIGDALLAAASPAAGERVLDVGCGCGATTLVAAEQIGHDGAAVGIDLSEPMLAVARRRAEQARTANAAFVQADAQTHQSESRSDLIISRFGTMFFTDPTAAFTNLHRTLVPGGRLCVATWQPLEANEWLTIPGAALLQYANLPATGPAAPGMFAQSDPDTVRGVLAASGFDDVEIDPVSVALTVGATVEEAVDYLADSGPGRAVLESVDDRIRPDALAGVADSLRSHADGTGVHLDAAVWLVRACVAG